jgi:hypothetical protein
VWTYLAFGYAAAMLANVLPHIATSIATRTYMPGLGSAVLLNAPVLGWLVIVALREGYVSGGQAAGYAGSVAAVLLLSIPGLLCLGKAIRL